MCQRRPGLSSATDTSPPSLDNSKQPQMDTHLIVDIVTLCVVACLVLLFIASRALKKRKTALSLQSKGSQTDNPVLRIDGSINRLDLEVSTLQQRLESLEQGRLEAVSIHLLQSSMPSKSAHFTEEDESSGQEQCNWAGSTAMYPAV